LARSASGTSRCRWHSRKGRLESRPARPVAGPAWRPRSRDRLDVDRATLAPSGASNLATPTGQRTGVHIRADTNAGLRPCGGSRPAYRQSRASRRRHGRASRRDRGAALVSRRRRTRRLQDSSKRRRMLSINAITRAPGPARALRHEPISHGWLLLTQNAVVRDRDRGLSDGIDVDRVLDGSAPGR
jgi:hypothetical protein